MWVPHNVKVANVFQSNKETFKTLKAMDEKLELNFTIYENSQKIDFQHPCLSEC